MEIEKGEIVTLDNNKEYLCFSAIESEGKKYLFLMTTSEPIEICFAEQTVDEVGVQIRAIGGYEEKQRLLRLFQEANQKKM